MRFTLLLCTLLLTLGCSSDALHFPPPVSTFNQPEADFDTAPKQLYETAKMVAGSPPLSLPIEQEKNGTFTTGYKEYPGEWHIARRWQERTRFRVTVIPDFDKPTARARLAVAEETESRATDGQTWKATTDTARPERAREFLQKIEARIKPSATTQPEHSVYCKKVDSPICHPERTREGSTSMDSGPDSSRVRSE
jgi:hypothetical protein